MRTLLLVICLALVACGAPQITIPAGQASILWGQVRSDYAVAKVVITQGCLGGKIDKESCDALNAIDIRAQTLRASVEKSLANPTQPVDWSQVMGYASSVTEMLIKLGVLAIK